MSYSALVNRGLRLLFLQLKDLAVVGTFTKKSGDFDFSALTVSNVETNVEAKVVVMSGKGSKDSRDVKSKRILFTKSDVGELSLYDSVTIDNVVWKIGDIDSDGGRVVMVKIHRE